MKVFSGFKAILTRQPTDLWVLINVYMLAYTIYRFALGGGFYTGDLSDMHYLPLNALYEDLLRTLLYLHAQPPLMNLLAGVILKLWQGHYAVAFATTYFFAGLAAVALLFHTLTQLGIGRWPRFAVCFALCSFPTLFLYATWAYSTHLEFCLGSAAAYCLALYHTAPGHRRGALFGLFGACCLLGLLHAQWHIALFLGLAALMCLLEPRAARRQVIIAAALCLLPLGAWYCKNLVMFGFWGTSSWMGANMAQLLIPDMVHTDSPSIAQPEIDALKAQHLISPDFPAVYDFDKVIRRAPQASLPPSGVPALAPYKYSTWPNYNYPGMIVSARQDWRDAMVVIEHNKLQYLHITGRKMWDMLWRPSLAYNFMPGIDNMLRAQGRNIVPGEGYNSLPATVKDVAEASSFLLYGCVPALLLALALAAKPAGSLTATDGARKFIFCACYLMFAELVVICFFNAFEQERLRWALTPFYLAFAGIGLEVVGRVYRSISPERAASSLSS